jgi:ABC-type glycerol-3-phosphate transport system permease component
MGGVNQYWAIILVMTTYQLPQAMFLYINFINAIPVALDEAATIDGCGPIRTFFHIILPQLKPVTASVIILGCMIVNRRNWQSYLMWQLLMVLCGLLPMILYLKGLEHNVYLSFMPLAVSGAIFLGTVIIGDRRARMELIRRFHF